MNPARKIDSSSHSPPPEQREKDDKLKRASLPPPNTSSSIISQSPPHIIEVSSQPIARDDRVMTPPPNSFSSGRNLPTLLFRRASVSNFRKGDAIDGLSPPPLTGRSSESSTPSSPSSGSGTVTPPISTAERERIFSQLGSKSKLADALASLSDTELSPKEPTYQAEEEKHQTEDLLHCRRSLRYVREKRLTVDAFFQQLQHYENCKKLRPFASRLGAEILRTDEQGELFFHLLNLSAAVGIQSDVPYRSESCGALLFCASLQTELESLLGKQPFASILFHLLQRGRYASKKESSPPASPNERECEELTRDFLSTTADLFLLKVFDKNPFLTRLTGSFIGALQVRGAVRYEWVFLGIFLQRCLVTELVAVSEKLSKSSKFSRIGFYMKNYSIFIQKMALKLPKEQVSCQESLLQIFRSLTSKVPPQVTLAPLPLQLMAPLQRDVIPKSRSAINSQPETEEILQAELARLSPRATSSKHPHLLHLEKKHQELELQLIDLCLQQLCEGKMKIEAFYEELDAYDAMRKLKGMLPNITAQLSKLGIEDRLFLSIMEQNVILSKAREPCFPFRGESPGLSWFTSQLASAIAELAGNLPFASCAFLLLREAATQDGGEPVALYDHFLTQLAKIFTEKIAKKSPLLSLRCRQFVQLVEKHNFPSINAHHLLLNVLFLRCINPELIQVAAKFTENGPQQRQKIGNLIKSLSKYLQTIANSLLSNQAVQLDQRLNAILSSLLT